MPIKGKIYIVSTVYDDNAADYELLSENSNKATYLPIYGSGVMLVLHNGQ